MKSYFWRGCIYIQGVVIISGWVTKCKIESSGNPHPNWRFWRGMSLKSWASFGYSQNGLKQKVTYLFMVENRSRPPDLRGVFLTCLEIHPHVNRESKNWLIYSRGARGRRRSPLDDIFYRDRPNSCLETKPLYLLVPFQPKAPHVTRSCRDLQAQQWPQYRPQTAITPTWGNRRNGWKSTDYTKNTDQQKTTFHTYDSRINLGLLKKLNILSLSPPIFSTMENSILRTEHLSCYVLCVPLPPHCPPPIFGIHRPPPPEFKGVLLAEKSGKPEPEKIRCLR